MSIIFNFRIRVQINMYSTIKHTSKSTPFKITAYFAYIEIINKN